VGWEHQPWEKWTERALRTAFAWVTISKIACVHPNRQGQVVKIPAWPGQKRPSVIEVRDVSSRAALAEFVDFPYRKYRNHPSWVPPLRMSERDRFNQRKSPFLEHADMGLFLAVDKGATVGRIAAIDDHTHNATHCDNLAAFGFFEAN